MDDLSQLAFGFGNGAVTVIRGDLVHDRGAKQRTVFESKEPITGIEFREGNTTALYIATTSRILTLVISGRGAGQPARTLDDVGCDVDCMTIDKSTQDVIVARNDAIYYYGLHGRSSSYNCDGEKTMLKTFKDYLVFSCPANTSSLSRSTAYGAMPSEDQSWLSRSALTMLNPDFHFIAHSEALASQFHSCFVCWDDLFVVTLDGKIVRYHEKPLNQRLDVLFQRNLYVLAIQIAQRAGMNASQQNTIFRRYGDYLYSKRDYDTAMQQYLRAIESSEPSQIIRKYLGTQQINNLITYLEELHEHHKANSDHTILLLNCYAKLKDVRKLENFIKSPGDMKFDIDTAISMCRQGGYFDQAAYLARKHQEHDVVVSVLIEDLKKYAEALAYIWRLEPDPAYENLIKYATVLLEHCPGEATNLFIDYYTGKFKPKQDAVITTTTSTTSPQQPPQPTFASSAVQSLASILPLPYMSMPSFRDETEGQEGKIETRIVESISSEPAPRYATPKPRTAFSAFVDHPMEFVQFLEACRLTDILDPADRSDINTTLFEMYLRQANSFALDSKDKKQWEDRARALILSQKEDADQDSKMDPSNVLLLSDLSRFKIGTTLVREQQGLHADIFRSYTSARDTQGAIKALRKYGPEDPSLYPSALAYYTSSTEVMNETGAEEVDAVLRKIETDQLLSPLQVVQTLSKNSVATMGLIKRYLRDIVAAEREEITRNRKATDTFRADTVQKQEKLKDLNELPQSFKATRCSSCHYAIEQPIVHFFCQHSFHRRCLNLPSDDSQDDGFNIEGQGVPSVSLDNVECPICAPQNATIRQVKRAQEGSREKHDVFKGALDRSSDRFGTVAEWFGRGVMNAPRGEL